jgi:hypothetical protein
MRRRSAGLNLFGCVFFTAVALHIPAAQAQSGSVKAIFEKHNLLGIWAWDCSRPASRNNWYFVHRLVDADHVQRDYMIEPTNRAWFVMVDKAVELNPKEVAIAGTRDGQPADGVWRLQGNRMLQWEGSMAGKKQVSAGKLVSTGRDMLWHTKCG